MTDMKSIPALSFKRTCALNATSNNLRLFISFRVNCFHMKISCRFEISFRSKWPIWNPYRFEFHFASIHLNASTEMTENRSEIFNRNEITYRFEFISPLIWTYSYFWIFLQISKSFPGEACRKGCLNCENEIWKQKKSCRKICTTITWLTLLPVQFFPKTSNPKLTKFTVKKSNFNSRVLIDWSVAVTTIP